MGEVNENKEMKPRISLITRIKTVEHRIGIRGYLHILAELIDQFEKSARLKVDLAGQTAADVIGHLVEVNGLTVSGLAREIGMGQSNLSEMLSGRRDFSKAAIGKLCGRFGISAEVFFGTRPGR